MGGQCSWPSCNRYFQCDIFAQINRQEKAICASLSWGRFPDWDEREQLLRG